jgi:Flp pilus assembly protein CpaB
VPTVSVTKFRGQAEQWRKDSDLSLTPEQAQRVYLAEGNGTIRLAVRPYGEADERPVDYMTELELFPQNLPNPFTR